ncbi:MAG TPA: aminoglycoside phosphotransferase family protein [Gaiellaceae bacterium]|nr:aminoglycoside phosphotransferase family protein [Gaiellaceae bacterium]
MVEPLRLRPLPRRPAFDPVALKIPSTLEWWRATPAGAAWLDRLPALVASLAERWCLTLGDPYDARIALVLHAERRDGTRAVLKLNLVEPENEHEALALDYWPDDASIRVLEHDDDLGALLLERCEPGTTLWELPEEDALLHAARVLARLFDAGDPGPPFRRLVDEAPRWTETLATRPFEPALLDEALAALRELPASQRGPVVVSEDFHGGNVLRADRGWLAIDPKPIVAEPEFGVVSLVRDRRPLDGPTVARRLDFLSAELGLDRERMRRWSLAHVLWWGFEGDRVLQEHVEAARLLTK